jgi:hypothetical protein
MHQGKRKKEKGKRQTQRVALSSVCLFPFAFVLFPCLAGCWGGPTPVSAPSLSPQAAAQAAMAEYDVNRDGFLDAQELVRCPALAHGLKALDKNGDKRISADELAERLEAFAASNVGLVGIPCSVQLDGNPLEGAKVTLRPEKFMGESFQPASGVSDHKGHVLLRTEGQDLPGTQWGYFQLEVSKTDAAGKETLPQRYNMATTLGQEVRPDRREAIVLHLSSR